MRKHLSFKSAIQDSRFLELILKRADELPPSITQIAAALSDRLPNWSYERRIGKAVELVIRKDLPKLRELGFCFSVPAIDAQSHLVANLLMDPNWRPGKKSPDIKTHRERIAKAEAERTTEGRPALPRIHFVSGGKASSG